MTRRQRTPDPPPISHRPSSSWAAALVAVSMLLGGCKDSPTDLLPGLVAGETQPALALGVVLPDPTAWAASASGPADGGALSAWTSSWDLPEPRGQEVRERSYEGLVALVPDGRLAGVTADELATLQAAVERARSLSAGGMPPTVQAGLRLAGTEVASALAARDRGDDAGALVHVLRGGDALREVGPEAVARALVDGVEGSLRRIRPSASYSPQDAERLRRLAEGGRQALEDGDWVLAIRRAYYARALLTVH